MKAVLGLKERMKERDALDVIPMVVAYQDMGVDAAQIRRSEPIAEHTKTCAAIEDEPNATRSSELNAGRISAVAPRIALQRRRRAAHSPKDQLGHIMRHCWVNGDARA